MATALEVEARVNNLLRERLRDVRCWIRAPHPPGEAALEELRARCAAEPRIAQAWLTGSRYTPGDDAPTYETTDVALVLDPPPAHGDESEDDAIIDLIANLDAASIGDGRLGYMTVSATEIRVHAQHAVLVYSRA